MPAQPQTSADRIKRASTLARSGARRYPTELLNSIKRGDAAAARRALDHAAACGPLSAAWLGHATVLVRLGEQWVLTDPVFSARIGVKIGPWTFGVGRLLPAFDPAALPPIDLILVSHAHFDHLDKPSLKALATKRTRVVTAMNTKSLIPRGFADVRELNWEDTIEAGPLRLRAMRPAHWGARTAWDKHRGFNSYILDAPDAAAHANRVLYAGDTAMSDAYTKVGGVDLSIFGIGAYDPWVHAHATPEQVWNMHTMAKGRYLLPIHHSTYKLSDEPAGEPLARLLAAAGDRADSVVGREMGDIWKHPA